VQESRTAYLSDLASTLRNEGDSAVCTKNRDEARAFYQEALANYKELEILNKPRYAPEVATVAKELGDINANWLQRFFSTR